MSSRAFKSAYNMAVCVWNYNFGWMTMGLEKVMKRSLPVPVGVTSLGYQCKQCGQLFSPVAPPIHPADPLRLSYSAERSYGSNTPFRGGGVCLLGVVLGP